MIKYSDDFSPIRLRARSGDCGWRARRLIIPRAARPLFGGSRSSDSVAVCTCIARIEHGDHAGWIEPAGNVVEQSISLDAFLTWPAVGV